MKIAEKISDGVRVEVGHRDVAGLQLRAPSDRVEKLREVGRVRRDGVRRGIAILPQEQQKLAGGVLHRAPAQDDRSAWVASRHASRSRNARSLVAS